MAKMRVARSVIEMMIAKFLREGQVKESDVTVRGTRTVILSKVILTYTGNGWLLLEPKDSKNEKVK